MIFNSRIQNQRPDPVCALDGVIEKLVLADIEGDAQTEIVVVVRSVGTGSYLSAYAFGVVQRKTLVPVASITGLSATAAQ